MHVLSLCLTRYFLVGYMYYNIPICEIHYKIDQAVAKFALATWQMYARSRVDGLCCCKKKFAK